MWKSKKFIIIAVLAAIILAGTIGGVALAQDNGNGKPDPRAQHTALLEKVAEIYEENTGTAIDAAELEKAFSAAREEISTQVREQMRQRLVDEGIVTQEQLDELEAWLQSRPEIPSEEFKEWLEARPDIDIGPFGGGRGHASHRGFGGFCPSDAPDD